MPTTGRRWMLAFPLALGLGLGVLPLAKASVDSSLADGARSALAAAGVTGVDVTSDWAGLRLSGPPASRSAALAAVGRMEHRDAVARVEYAVPAALAPGTPSPSLSPSLSPSPTPAPQPPVDVAVALAVTGDAKARGVRIEGTVAGDRAHAALLAAVKVWAPTVSVDDATTVVEGVPSDAVARAWPVFLRMAGPAAASLAAKGRVSLRADGIALSGLAASESTANALAALAREAGGRGVAVTSTVVGPVTVGRRQLAAVKGLTGVKFTRGSEVLTAGSRKTLDAAAKIIKALPAGVSVEIRGFTDDKGDAGLNARLSKRRADSVRKYLISKGVPASRLSARGFGEKLPRASNATDKGRAANRRIEFVVKGS